MQFKLYSAKRADPAQDSIKRFFKPDIESIEKYSFMPDLRYKTPYYRISVLVSLTTTILSRALKADLATDQLVQRSRHQHV